MFETIKSIGRGLRREILITRPWATAFFLTKDLRRYRKSLVKTKEQLQKMIEALSDESGKSEAEVTQSRWQRVPLEQVVTKCDTALAGIDGLQQTLAEMVQE